MMLRFPIVLGSAVLAASVFLSGCSTTGYDPCSKAGIQARVESSLKSYAIKNRNDIRRLKQVSQYLGGDSVHGNMQIVFGLEALTRMVSSFEDDVMPELSAISKQCGSSNDVRDVFLDFLKDQGVSQKVLKWIEGSRFSLSGDDT